MPVSKAYTKHLKEQAETNGGASVVDEPQASATAGAVAEAEIDENVPAPATEDGQWAQVSSGLHRIPMELISESPENARLAFDEEALSRLADSLRVDGINEVPAKVRPDGSGGFVLFDGARRYRGLKLIHAPLMLCLVETVSDTEAFRKSMLSFLHREDLNPIEKGAAYGKLVRLYGNARAMAGALGLNERSILDLLSLTDLIDAVKAAVIEGRITLSHAVLIAREDQEDQAAALEACFKLAPDEDLDDIDVRTVLVTEKELRAWIKEHLREAKAPEPQIPFDPTDPGADAADEANTSPDEDDLTPAQRKEVMPTAAEAAEQLDADAKPREKRMEEKAGPTADRQQQTAQSGTDAIELEVGVRRRLVRRLVEKCFCDGGNLTPLIAEKIWGEFAGDYPEEAKEAKFIIAGHGSWKPALVKTTPALAQLLVLIELAGYILAPKYGSGISRPVLLIDYAKAAGVDLKALEEEERYAKAGMTPKKVSPQRRKDAKNGKKKPTPAQVSKVMKAEKAKLAGKSKR